MSFDEGHDRYVQPRNRQGFRKVVCMGSPDGKEVWLTLLLGGKGAEVWVEAIHFESGVRPAGQVRPAARWQGAGRPGPQSAAPRHLIPHQQERQPRPRSPRP